MTDAPDPGGYVLAVDLADRMGVSRYTIYTHIRKRILPAEKINGRVMVRNDHADHHQTAFASTRRRARTPKPETEPAKDIRP